jgi:hypothetical protein
MTDDHPYERFFIGIQPKQQKEKQKQKQMVHYASTPYGLLQFVQSRLHRCCSSCSGCALYD